MDARLRALNRFGLGARPGEKDGLSDARGWLRAQLAGSGEMDAVAGVPALEGIGDALHAVQAARRSRDREQIQAARQAVTEIARLETRAVLDRRVRTTAPFVERLVAFWSNHLCISTVNPTIAALAGHYERSVVRRHVLGRFRDMVLASARHPAMLLYLDNAQSIGPGSIVGRRAAGRGRARGLNENYARELLELHMLGVDGGYAQEDVEALARVLTGWTVSGIGRGAQPDNPVGFVFRPELHEPGAKTVLGERYPEGGAGEGEDVITDLCAHPSTARFVAGKLARHFVADEPPPGAVDALAAVFLETGGDLRAVALALVALEEAWAPEALKLRTPQDWLVAALRALGAEEAPPEGARALARLRHALWAPPAPKGYGDARREWADPDALMNRAELARTLARRSRRQTPDPAGLAEVVDLDAGDPLPGLLRDPDVPRDERVALALAGPAFQWR